MNYLSKDRFSKYFAEPIYNNYEKITRDKLIDITNINLQSSSNKKVKRIPKCNSFIEDTENIKKLQKVEVSDQRDVILRKESENTQNLLNSYMERNTYLMNQILELQNSNKVLQSQLDEAVLQVGAYKYNNSYLNTFLNAKLKERDNYYLKYELKNYSISHHDKLFIDSLQKIIHKSFHLINKKDKFDYLHLSQNKNKYFDSYYKNDKNRLNKLYEFQNSHKKFSTNNYIQEIIYNVKCYKYESKYNYYHFIKKFGQNIEYKQIIKKDIKSNKIDKDQYLNRDLNNKGLNRYNYGDYKSKIYKNKDIEKCNDDSLISLSYSFEDNKNTIFENKVNVKSYNNISNIYSLKPENHKMQSIHNFENLNTSNDNFNKLCRIDSQNKNILKKKGLSSKYGDLNKTNKLLKKCFSSSLSNDKRKTNLQLNKSTSSLTLLNNDVNNIKYNANSKFNNTSKSSTSFTNNNYINKYHNYNIQKEQLKLNLDKITNNAINTSNINQILPNNDNDLKKMPSADISNISIISNNNNNNNSNSIIPSVFNDYSNYDTSSPENKIDNDEVKSTENMSDTRRKVLVYEILKNEEKEYHTAESSITYEIKKFKDSYKLKEKFYESYYRNENEHFSFRSNHYLDSLNNTL